MCVFAETYRCEGKAGGEWCGKGKEIGNRSVLGIKKERCNMMMERLGFEKKRRLT